MWKKIYALKETKTEHLCNNVHASFKYKTHRCVFTYSDKQICKHASLITKR